MKKIGTLITVLILLSNIVSSQDSLYIYKSGAVVYKRAVAQIDSIIFYDAGSGPSTCGTLTDARDGKTYNTVLIGTQCWMAQNLNYSTSGVYTPLATGQGAAGTQKYCYDNLESNCTTYGGLYEWVEMMNGSASCNGTGSSQPACTNPVQGICPSGWHIPSHYEWTLLEKNVGSNPDAFPYDMTTTGWLGTDEGSNLKESGTAHWQLSNTGTNTSGFTALPGGYSWYGTFYALGSNGHWWTSTESSTSYAWYRYLYFASAPAYRDNNFDKAFGQSVRCVKDN